MSAVRNPYEFGPTDNPRLLRTRRAEIRALLEALAPDDGRARHALVVGDARSGRTSMLREVARRAKADRRAMVVWLRLLDNDLTTSGLSRALLNAAVEALVDGQERSPDWYLAWCDRVHLRDRSPAGLRDRLVSGLVFAADSAAILDRALLHRDLRSLSRLAAEQGFSRILVCIDDADPLLEDVDLTDGLLDALDAADHWSVAMVTSSVGRDHLIQAVSPYLRRFEQVPLAPFWTPDKIRACLTAPLDAEEARRLMPDDPIPLLSDLLWLTGGNSFEIALVAHHLWVACRLGEQEHYELTTRVLERALPHLALCTGAESDILTGARAVHELDPSKIGPALDLVALSQLTAREIAIARLLDVLESRDAVNERLLTSSIDDEEARVVEELEDLERLGVVSVEESGRFSVQGGHSAAVALKYEARSLLGPTAGDKPFGIPFLPCVGEPLAQEYARRAIAALPGSRRLAWTAVFSPSATSASARLRAAINARPFRGLDGEMLPLDNDAYERIAELVVDPPTRAVVLVDFTLASSDRVLDWVEVWEVPPDTDLHSINQALADVLDGWQALVVAAEIHWRGSHAVLFDGRAAGEALVQLCPAVSDAALDAVWPQWRDGDRSTKPDDVLRVVETTVRALKAHRVPDWERGWELSTALSRLGFLLSFYEDRLDEARDALEHARNPGPGDGWVTAWNLAYVSARAGDLDAARRELDGLEEDIVTGTGADLLFFVPGRKPVASLFRVDAESGAKLAHLQRMLIAYLAGEASVSDLIEVMEQCRESGQNGRTVAGWVEESLESEVSAPKGA